MPAWPNGSRFGNRAAKNPCSSLGCVQWALMGFSNLSFPGQAAVEELPWHLGPFLDVTKQDFKGLTLQRGESKHARWGPPQDEEQHRAAASKTSLIQSRSMRWRSNAQQKECKNVGRAAPGGSVPPYVWVFHPTLCSLEGCKSPSMTVHALTSSASSMHGHGAAALLAEQQFKIIAASASPPPPAIPAECCAEQTLLQPPHTKKELFGYL